MGHSDSTRAWHLGLSPVRHLFPLLRKEPTFPRLRTASASAPSARAPLGLVRPLSSALVLGSASSSASYDLGLIFPSALASQQHRALLGLGLSRSASYGLGLPATPSLPRPQLFRSASDPSLSLALASALTFLRPRLPCSASASAPNAEPPSASALPLGLGPQPFLGTRLGLNFPSTPTSHTAISPQALTFPLSSSLPQTHEHHLSSLQQAPIAPTPTACQIHPSLVSIPALSRIGPARSQLLRPCMCSAWPCVRPWTCSCLPSPSSPSHNSCSNQRRRLDSSRRPSAVLKSPPGWLLPGLPAPCRVLHRLCLDQWESPALRQT